jgi:hypothetical protein
VVESLLRRHHAQGEKMCIGLYWCVVEVGAAMARGNAHDVSTSISNDDEMRGA